MEEQTNQRNGAQESREKSENGATETKGPIPEEKVTANGPNDQHSPGQKTTARKANSSPDSYQHGLCAQHLFRPGPQEALDRDAYEKLATRIRDHYQPEGVMEEFLVEKIVTEMVRYARIIGHEQGLLGYRRGFNYFSVPMILRYSTSSERQLMRSIKELERVQAAREIVSPMSESSAAELRDRPPDRARASDDASWKCLSSIRFEELDNGEARAIQIPRPPANGQARPSGSGPTDKSPAQEVTPPPPRKPWWDVEV